MLAIPQIQQEIQRGRFLPNVPTDVWNGGHRYVEIDDSEARKIREAHQRHGRGTQILTTVGTHENNTTNKRKRNSKNAATVVPEPEPARSIAKMISDPSSTKTRSHLFLEEMESNSQLEIQRPAPIRIDCFSWSDFPIVGQEESFTPGTMESNRLVIRKPLPTTFKSFSWSDFPLVLREV